MERSTAELILSIILALVFLASALPKLRRPKSFVLVVLEYRVLPPALGRLYARLLPPLELLVALLLAVGTMARMAAILSVILLASFMVAIAINLARGRDLDCGCFGQLSRRIGPGLLIQDATLLIASAGLALLAGNWTALAPWSIFRLSSATGSIVTPAAVCVVLALGLVLLLGKLGARDRPTGAGAVTEERRATRSNLNREGRIV